MMWERLLEKKKQLRQIWEHIPKEALESFEKSFAAKYAHHSISLQGDR